MKRKKQRTKARKIADTVIYSVAVILLFFSVVLFLQEFEYIPEDVYSDPPPPAPTDLSATPYSTQAVYVPSPSALVMPTESPEQTGAPQIVTSATPSQSAAPRQSTEPTAKPTKTPDAEAFDLSLLHPVKLYFVDRRISCDVIPVGLTSRYEMQTIRSAYDAGWLYKEPYVVPGDTGKAVIAGHNRWAGHNGTFSVLKKLQIGEQIAVELSDGYARYFVVDEITECAYDDNSIMEPVYDRPVLVLITCKGDWDSVLHMSRTRVIAICSPMQ